MSCRLWCLHSKYSTSHLAGKAHWCVMPSHINTYNLSCARVSQRLLMLQKPRCCISQMNQQSQVHTQLVHSCQQQLGTSRTLHILWVLSPAPWNIFHVYLHLEEQHRRLTQTGRQADRALSSSRYLHHLLFLSPCRVRSAFTLVQVTRVSQPVTIKLITESVASSFFDNSFPPFVYLKY